MPSAIPAQDVSVKWPACPACPRKHRPNTPCARPGLWLISGKPVLVDKNRWGTP